MMRKVGLLLVSAGLVAGVLAGCSGGDESTGADSTAAVTAADGAGRAEPRPASGSADSVQLGDRQAEDSLASGSEKDAPEPNAAPQERQVTSEQLAPRKLARDARMQLRVKDVAESAAEARDIAEEAGGYTGSERTRAKSARLTLTVPARELDAVLDELETLGKREGRDVSVKDVTDKVVDVNSRVKSQRRSIERSRDLFDQARTINEIVRVEQRLAAREAELEALLARQKALAGQVQMAPVTVTLLREKAAASANKEDDRPAGFAAGLSGGWDAFVTVLAAAATALGAAAPFLLAFGLPALVLLVVLRRRRKPVVGEADAA